VSSRCLVRLAIIRHAAVWTKAPRCYSGASVLSTSADIARGLLEPVDMFLTARRESSGRDMLLADMQFWKR
jgi:hypothetical protein